MDPTLKGKTAVLTGAARVRGLGYAFSRALAALGVNIVIADVRDGSAAVEGIQGSGGQAIALKCDVSNPADVELLRAATEDRFGGCDILVHCASPTPSHSIEAIEPDEWRDVLAVNLDGIYLVTRAFLPGMKRRGWGRIIPISSTTYHAGLGGRTHNVAAKAALIGFARSLAREVGPFGITVNVLAPGLVRTDASDEAQRNDATFGAADAYAILRTQQCIPQTLVPENLAGPLLFLASNYSTFVTGQTLLVDAGWQRVG